MRRLEGRLRSFTLPVIRGVIVGYREDRLPGLAAEIAFFTFLALIPATLVIIAALGSLEFLLGSDLAAASRQEVLKFLSSVLTERADATVEAFREIFTEGVSGLVSFATLGAFWALSRSLTGTIRALDVAYGLPRQTSWIKTRFKALLMSVGTVLLLALLMAVVVLGPFLGVTERLANYFKVGEEVVEPILLLRFPLALTLLGAWAALVYKLGPNHHGPLRMELPGAALTASLWLVSSSAFRFYLALASNINQVLGVVGGIITLLLWLYLLSLSLLIGAKFNAVIGALKRRPIDTTLTE